MISEMQKKIRRWFQRHGWHTGNTPTGTGAFLEAPVQKGVGYVQSYYDKAGNPVTEEKRLHWHNEYIAQFEIDRFDPNKLEIGIFKNAVFTAGPDFEQKNKPWPNHPECYFHMSYTELKKLTELMEVCIAEDKQLLRRI